MQTKQLLSHQNLIFSDAISKAIIVISTSQRSKSNGQYPHATNNTLCKCMQNLQYHVFIGCVEGKRCVGDGRNPHIGLLALAQETVHMNVMNYYLDFNCPALTTYEI